MKDSKAAKEHKHHSPKSLSIALFTVSSSRFKDRTLKDDSGETAMDSCKKAGHNATIEVIDDDKQMIRLHLMRSLFENGHDAAILLGGTGLSPRDVTIEAVRPILDKELDGFGEIFRSESYASIGSPAMMTRCLAGTVGSKVVFCLPGSPNAAKLGVTLCLKELPHAVFIAKSKP